MIILQDISSDWDISRTVCRDDVFVGQVKQTANIYRDENPTNFLGKEPNQLHTHSYFTLRSMLFVPDTQNFARDLLYKSPNYPVLNLTDAEYCLNLGESIVVDEICNLAELLEYFGYDKDLTFQQIKEIRRKFFTRRFGMDNCKLFGMTEHKPEDFTYYKNNIKITDPRKLKWQIASEKFSQWLGHRSFGSGPESTLRHEYFNVLTQLGDNDWRDWLHGFYEKGDMFKPDKKEGPIKKLKRF